MARKKFSSPIQSALDAAALKVSTLGPTKLPALFCTRPKARSFFPKAQAYSIYAIDPGVTSTREATPSLPLRPKPTGHSPMFLSPTLFFHWELFFEKNFDKLKVVREPPMQ